MKKFKCAFILCMVVIFTSGCWDRKELNERALWLATGWDVGKKENIQLSGQIVIPSSMLSESGGGGTKEFFTISAEGKNVNDTMQKLQAKISRESFTGHRRVIFLGEEFAKRGLKEQLDANTRGADVGLRADMFVVKGATALEALNLSDPLEKPPAVATIKGHEEYGGRGDLSFVNFLVAANTPGTSPSLPVIEIGEYQSGHSSGKNSERILEIVGLAVFNQDLKLVGYLNNLENRAFLWITGYLKKLSLTIPYNEGNASLILTEIKSKIIPKKGIDNKIHFVVQLTGEGAILENNTNEDLNDPKNIQKLRKAFEKAEQKRALNTIMKVQKKYGQDIFGFGDYVHKKYPHEWKSLRNDWNKHFSEADISVAVHLEIKRVGMIGPPILLKESEIEK